MCLRQTDRCLLNIVKCGYVCPVQSSNDDNLGFLPKQSSFSLTASKAAFDRVSFHDHYTVSLFRPSLHLSKELKNKNRMKEKRPGFYQGPYFREVRGRERPALGELKKMES